MQFAVIFKFLVGGKVLETMYQIKNVSGFSWWYLLHVQIPDFT